MAADSPAQIVLVTPELVEKLVDIKSEVIPINNIFDLAELTQKLESALT
jgi:galactitol-specific phosphotransferase system IIB component